MADQTVSISYQAYVTGLDKIEELSKKNKELQSSMDQYKKKLDSVSESSKKHENALNKARRAILDFRKEVFAITFGAAAVIAILKALASQSDSLGVIMEKGSDKIKSFANQLGDATAYAINFYRALLSLKSVSQALNFADQQKNIAPRSVQIQELSVRSQIASLAGNQEKALQLKQQSEILKLQDIGDKNRLKKFQKYYEEKHRLELMNLERSKQIEQLSIKAEISALAGDTQKALLLKQQAEMLQLRRDYAGKQLNVMMAFYNRKHELEKEDLRLTELGLERQAQILKSFQRDIVSGLQSNTSDILFKTFQGERQGFKEIVSSIRSTLNRALADALSKSISTSLFGGGGGLFDSIKSVFGFGKDQKQDATINELKKNNSYTSSISKSSDSLLAIARGIQNCVCATASNTGLMASGAGGGSRLTSAVISGAVGGGSSLINKISSVAGLFTSLGGINFGGGGGGSAANITMGEGAFKTNFAGGFIRKFAAGGEVPAFVQPGEFVVRKPVAQDNKDVLRELNMNGKLKNSGTPNVFLIKTNDAQSFVDMLSSPSSRNQIEVQVIRSILNNGEVRRVIKSFT